MSRRILLLLAVWLTACDRALVPEVSMADKPMRIISLDYCADQYVLKLADRAQILALSPDAEKDFSYMREAAAGIGVVRPVAEDVLIRKPDLVVRAYGGGPNITGFLERAGVPVLQVGWASHIAGEAPGSISALILHMADGLGQSGRGHVLVAEFTQRLQAVETRPAPARALYMTPAGATTGAGSLVHDMLVAAGYENFQTEPGWHSLPLERLAYDQPDLIAAAEFGTPGRHADRWSAAKHPVAQAQLSGPNVVPLQGAWTACGGWFILDAIEALADGAAT